MQMFVGRGLVSRRDVVEHGLAAGVAQGLALPLARRYPYGRGLVPHRGDRPRAGPHAAYWATPFPKDQFSRGTSTRLTSTSSGRTPARSRASAAMRA